MRTVLSITWAAGLAVGMGITGGCQSTPMDDVGIKAGVGVVRLASGLPGPGYWQQRTDYAIDAALDDEAKTITASETVTYTNNSPDELKVLWFYLEQNIYKSDSLGTLTTPPGTRFARDLGFNGGIKLAAVTIDGKDVPYAVYDTVLRLDLASAVPGRGGQVKVKFAWSFEIPTKGSDRMGIRNSPKGPVFELAQWYPMACVYDDVRGWNTLPYLGQGEFYSNFGSFDVRLTVPRSHIVAATGVLQNAGEVLTGEERSRLDKARTSDTTVTIIAKDEVGKDGTRPAGEGPLTWHFKADKVRSFAWASSKAFIWDACILKDSGPVGGDGTFIQSVYPEDAHWSDSTDLLKFAIAGYNKRWRRYPYPSATNVNGVAGGMEYPMIVFCGSRGGGQFLYDVLTHEIGHNWFPMVVNTDERRHAWMDEGFNTFINIYSNMEKWGGPGAKPEPALSDRSMANFGAPTVPPVETAADQIPLSQIGNLGYAKPAEALFLLREYVLGEERFDYAFRAYINAWAFKSPQPEDFFHCMNNAAGTDLTWFWHGWFLTNSSMDQAVVSASSNTSMGLSTARFTTEGGLVMPVIFKVKYEDGSTEVRKLPAEIWERGPSFLASWESGSKIVTSIQVDPDRVFPDTDRSNNTWTRTKAAGPNGDEEEPRPTRRRGGGNGGAGGNGPGGAGGNGGARGTRPAGGAAPASGPNAPVAPTAPAAPGDDKKDEKKSGQ